MSESRLIICGIARDCAPALTRLIPKIERLGRCFASHEVIVAENDSVDATREVLREWSKQNPNVTPIFYSNPKDLASRGGEGWFNKNRVERICDARNRYLEVLETRDAEFAIVMDMDILDFSLAGVAISLSDCDRWDISAGNGKRYTLRRPLSKSVYWDTYAVEPADGYSRGVQSIDFIRNQQIVLARQLARGKPITARSAFGGLCIYKHSLVAGLRYMPIDNDDVQIKVLCEHVAFHRSIRQSQPECSLVINPHQIVMYEPVSTTLGRTARRLLTSRGG